MVGHHDLASEILAASSAADEAAGNDPLSDVLRMVKLTGALFFLVDASSPWGVNVPAASCFRAADFSPCTTCHFLPYRHRRPRRGRVPGQPPVRFAAGDVIVFPHGDPYAMLSAPGEAAELEDEGRSISFAPWQPGSCPSWSLKAAVATSAPGSCAASSAAMRVRSIHCSPRSQASCACAAGRRSHDLWTA